MAADPNIIGALRALHGALAALTQEAEGRLDYRQLALVRVSLAEASTAIDRAATPTPTPTPTPAPAPTPTPTPTPAPAPPSGGTS